MKLIALFFSFSIFYSYAYNAYEDIDLCSTCKLDSISDESGDDYVTINIKVIDEKGKGVSKPGILCRYDSETYTYKAANKRGRLTLKTQPGKVSLHVNKSTYKEAKINYLMLDKNMNYTIEFTLKEIALVKPDLIKRTIIRPAKPVIYLYPERTMPFVLSVKNQGNFEFIYPGGQAVWEGIAHPDGKLEIDGGEYDYLFWDGKQKQSDFDNYVNVGSVVGKHDVVEFLETSLTTLALNSREQQDFISFWAPKMIHHDNVQVTFLVNNDYDVVSENTISPTPDTEIRVFMLFKPVLPGLELTPQQLPIIERKGFTVVEWGGAEMMNFEIP